MKVIPWEWSVKRLQKKHVHPVDHAPDPHAPRRIENGEVFLLGGGLLKLKEDEMREVCGA